MVMAELLENQEMETEAREVEAKETEAPAVEAPVASGFSEEAPAPRKKKRNKRKIVRRVVTLVILTAVAVGVYSAWRSLGQKEEDDGEVMTSMVGRGSITSTVEGSGAAVAKNSASITLLSGGEVLDVYVAEGDFVTAGTPLYTIESSDAHERVNEAQKTIRNYEKELNKLYEAVRDLNVRAEYAGKLMSVRKLNVGDSVNRGETLATLVDDTRLLLPLYFSYAYEGDIAVGQSAVVSIPVTMAQLTGEVREIHKVERVSSEGAALFEAVFVIDNPGTLTADMVATATVTGEGGETIYSYEPGKLEYFRSSEIKAKVNGEVSWCGLRDYARVAAGESVLTLTGDDAEAEIATLENQIRSAQKTLEDAQKNLDSLNGVATIDGTVISLGIHAGEEVTTGTVAVSIADTTTMIVNANLDEMYVAYAKVGMPVQITLWGETQMEGVIDSVSLSAKAENGVARFPMVISVDNSEGALMSGAYVNYSFTASQSDDCLVVPIECVKSVQTAGGETKKALFVRADEPPEDTLELAMEMTDIPEGFYPVAVEVGISDSHNIEILSGVEEFAEVFMSKVSGRIGMW